MMERKMGGEANESAAAPATATGISRLRKVEDGPELQLRASSSSLTSPPMHPEGGAADSQRPQATATIDQLEQQIRRHLSERSQAQPYGELQWDQPNMSDSWGHTQPPPPIRSQPNSHRGGEMQDGAWGRPTVAAGGSPEAGLTREGPHSNSPLFHLPAPALPQVSTAYLLPPPLVMHPLPSRSASQSSGATMVQRMQAAPAFQSAGVSGGGASDAVERSSSIMVPQQVPPPYHHLYHSVASPGSLTYETIDRSLYRPDGVAALPFPIINIPFRSKADRAASAAAVAAAPEAPGESDATSGVAAAAGGGVAPGSVTAAAVTKILNPLSSMLWRDHLPSTGKEPTFPMKLHQILASPQFHATICWNSHGRSWRIIKTQEFERSVIPLFFQHSKYSSFLRQVNGWGFERIVTGADHGSYFSRFFLRDNPSLCLTMKRKAKKKKQSADEVGPAREPAQNVNPPTNADAEWIQQDEAPSSGVRLTRDGTSTGGAVSYAAAPGSQLRPPSFLASAAAAPDSGGGGYSTSSSYPYHHGALNAAGGSNAASAPSRSSGDPVVEHARGTAHMVMGLEDLNRMYFMQGSPVARRGSDVPGLGHSATAPTHGGQLSGLHGRFHPLFQGHGMAPNLAFEQESRGTLGDVGGSNNHQGWLLSHQQRNNLQGNEGGVESILSSSSRLDTQQRGHELPSQVRPQESTSYRRHGAIDPMLSSSSGDDWNSGDPAEEASGAAGGALPLGAMSPLHFGENESTSSSAD